MLLAADCYVRGFFDHCLREQAHLFMALHLIEINNIASVEAASRLAAIAKGSFSRPNGNTSNDAWLGLTVWGQAYLALTIRDPDIGMLVI